MHSPVLYIAQRIGSAYRGEVLDAKTYSTLLKTAHTYPTEAVAKVAARRTWEDAQDHAEMLRNSVAQVAA